MAEYLPTDYTEKEFRHDISEEKRIWMVKRAPLRVAPRGKSVNNKAKGIPPGMPFFCILRTDENDCTGGNTQNTKSPP
ncbi:hypothetical protein [Agathobaculum sp.]|uniref:hypothetical protein n=1 Tax=Agathobaculum sp. TaxID=2048138 RepID=UPI003AF199A8